jgi:hypothetical protein
MRRSPSDRETQEVADEARRLFFYHADTGLILRRVYQMGKHVGEEAGGVRTDADSMTYRAVSILRRVFMSHRVAWLLHYGVWPTMRLDHRDGNGLNNRIDNLREVTNQQNGMNTKLRIDSKTGVSGIRWHKLAKKWNVRITVHNQEIYLGLYENFEDAVRVRKEAESKYGFSERHGTKADMGPPAESN